MRSYPAHPRGPHETSARAASALPAHQGVGHERETIDLSGRSSAAAHKENRLDRLLDRPHRRRHDSRRGPAAAAHSSLDQRIDSRRFHSRLALRAAADRGQRGRADSVRDRAVGCARGPRVPGPGPRGVARRVRRRTERGRRGCRGRARRLRRWRRSGLGGLLRLRARGVARKHRSDDRPPRLCDQLRSAVPRLAHRSDEPPRGDLPRPRPPDAWPSSAATRRDLYLEHPYRSLHPTSGYGPEDWVWNIDTTAAGATHLVAKDSVFFYRVRERGGVNNRHALSILPWFDLAALRRAPRRGIRRAGRPPRPARRPPALASGVQPPAGRALVHAVAQFRSQARDLPHGPMGRAWRGTSPAGRTGRIDAARRAGDRPRRRGRDRAGDHLDRFSRADAPSVARARRRLRRPPGVRAERDRRSGRRPRARSLARCRGRGPRRPELREGARRHRTLSRTGDRPRDIARRADPAKTDPDDVNFVQLDERSLGLDAGSAAACSHNSSSSRARISSSQ